MHAEELPDFSFIEINGLDCFRTVIHAEELPRCTLKNSREIYEKVSQAIDLDDDFPFVVFCPVFFFPVLSPKDTPPLGATPRRLLRASRSARAYGAPTRHPQGLCPSALGLTPINRPPEGAEQNPPKRSPPRLRRSQAWGLQPPDPLWASPPCAPFGARLPPT